jgi:hypothetical protein
MGRRRKWYDGAIIDYLRQGGADGLGCATSRHIQEMLYALGKRQVPRVGAISQTLRGLFDEQGVKIVLQVGVTKVARGESRVRGYDVAVWSYYDNPALERVKIKYIKDSDKSNV